MLVTTQVINKILQTKDFGIVKRNCLDESYFKGFTDEYKFIENHVNLYGNVPDLQTFIGKFTDFALFEVNETESYLIDKLYEEYGYQRFAEMLPILNTKVQEDSRIAYNFLQSELPKLKPPAICNGIDIIKESKERYDLYANRSNAPESATIKTGLKELDDIFGGWEYGDELVTLVARTNQGKCERFGTKILMADGTLKNVEDIVVGDKVQSCNSINTVLGTHKGRSKGYRITPLKAGNSFDITDDHIMTVWHRNQYWDSDRKQMVTDGTGTLIDIKIEDFLKKSKRFQHDCFLYRPFVEYDEKELKIPPYILGLWLGDGTSCRVELTNKDEVVIESWKKYALDSNMCVNIQGKKDTNVAIMDITTGKKGKVNPILNIFRELNLLNNKHIPLEYLTSSREQRLELLAGLIDTDGHYDKKTHMYEITTKLKVLSDNYCQLLRGLGFKVNHHIKHNKKYNKDYYKVSFSGDLQDIPCRLRKASVDSTIRRESCISRFKVERIEEEFDYAGFECDGDHRFMLGDNTLTHNSWLLMKFLVEAWKQGKRVGLYSGEMSHIKLGYRFDALFGHYSNKCLSQGWQVDSYDSYIENLKSLPNPFIIITQKEFGGRPTVQKIRNFIECNNIEIMGIDQYSLMEDGRSSFRDPTRLKLSHIAEDLFLLSSEYRIPILGLAQANREGAKKETEDQAPGLENIKESDDIAHNSSKCIGMKQSTYGLILDIIKNREGKVGDKLMYSWDIDTGHFSYIPSSGDAASPEIRQQAQQQTRQQFSSVNPF